MLLRARHHPYINEISFSWITFFDKLYYWFSSFCTNWNQCDWEWIHSFITYVSMCISKNSSAIIRNLGFFHLIMILTTLITECQIHQWMLQLYFSQKHSFIPLLGNNFNEGTNEQADTSNYAYFQSDEELEYHSCSFHEVLLYFEMDVCNLIGHCKCMYLNFINNCLP